MRKVLVRRGSAVASTLSRLAARRLRTTERDRQLTPRPSATAFIVEQFGSYSQRMSDFAARAFRENWIDAEPRPGKRDGAWDVL